MYLPSYNSFLGAFLDFAKRGVWLDGEITWGVARFVVLSHHTPHIWSYKLAEQMMAKLLLQTLVLLAVLVTCNLAAECHGKVSAGCL